MSTSDYTLVALDESALRAIYHDHMVVDFPVEERKPLEAMCGLLARGDYHGYGYYRGQELIAYGFVIGTGHDRLQLLDYLAVVAAHRNGGHGSAFLQQLIAHPAHHGGLLVELEDVAHAASGVDAAVRQRRYNFYQRHGFRLSGVSSDLFGVHFVIAYHHQSLHGPEAIAGELARAYTLVVPAKLYDRSVAIYRDDALGADC